MLPVIMFETKHPPGDDVMNPCKQECSGMRCLITTILVYKLDVNRVANNSQACWLVDCQRMS
jgi:hypothetical protein